MDKCHCTPIKDKRQGIRNWISLKEEKKKKIKQYIKLYKDFGREKQ